MIRFNESDPIDCIGAAIKAPIGLRFSRGQNRSFHSHIGFGYTNNDAREVILTLHKTNVKRVEVCKTVVVRDHDDTIAQSISTGCAALSLSLKSVSSTIDAGFLKTQLFGPFFSKTYLLLDYRDIR